MMVIYIARLYSEYCRDKKNESGTTTDFTLDMPTDTSYKVNVPMRRIYWRSNFINTTFLTGPNECSLPNTKTYDGLYGRNGKAPHQWRKVFKFYCDYCLCIYWIISLILSVVKPDLLGRVPFVYPAIFQQSIHIVTEELLDYLNRRKRGKLVKLDTRAEVKTVTPKTLKTATEGT